ncbi:fungal-specific transcription factor domain-containing protein [Gymnopilus junonius]|uniref:Fungal-specific transcription factor domain-containing protein n=1 Tax=Gymnopilus junonius TaxID=109634 RepID=A0A9P5NZ85_GYMJU|nr:fungal-specific transcription factor domain-containing protein [Gymnopilus junonius]
MGSLTDAHLPYSIGYSANGASHTHQVKTEDLSSPDLSPANSAIPQFQFKFQPSHDSLSHSRNSSEIPQAPLYRFGFNNQHIPTWSPVTVSHLPPRVDTPAISPHEKGVGPNHFSFGSSVEPQAMSYSDDYDDLADLPPDQQGLGASGNSANDRTVRRRSSKACDQCRKSKCKCERSGPNEPCKNCIMLGTPCTFLGPSRKRGPPKGYIDAIEARLHQTEALLGIMLATSDTRAQSLLRDIGKDPLAKEIIARVDNSPYGVKGRKREDIALSIGGKVRSAHSSDTSLPNQTKGEPAVIDLTTTHPSNEWQDRVSSMLNTFAAQQPSTSSTGHRAESRQAYTPSSHSSDDNLSPGGRRLRRRIGEEDYSLQQGPSAAAAIARYRKLNRSSRTDFHGRDKSPSVDENSMTSDSEEEVTGAIGQLSLNEDEQVRYHGKASGLQFLGNKERVDRRNEGGIWRFPKARVWPPLPSGSAVSRADEVSASLPSLEVQEHLLDLYFTYVQPFFPIIHKRTFWKIYRASNYPESPQSPDLESPSGTSPFSRGRRGIPALLLLSMFALASRYDDNSSPIPSDPAVMWSAGDEYLDQAKIVLDSTYASSRPSTCQALLLMGYREIGIGAMAQAWTYIGMAIRMAQDLGMHRSADGWERVGLGGRLFGESELNERKRIWYGCVIMDKYVSTYIGRPLMIFDWDFDTTLPNADDPEEFDEWSMDTPGGQKSSSVPGRNISCFSASATLAGILGMIVQSIYAVRPVSSRHAESTVLEGLLDKWYYELPEHLRYEPSSSKSAPLPNVLTLHMQYWTTVLLLHRPFIRHIVQAKQRQSEVSEDAETRAIAAKSYELCNGAANHITSIVSLYQEKYLITRCPVFLTYYVFTAGIMHDTNLTVHPNDPQSSLGLTKCMDILRAMKIVWPSASRQLDLFGGARGVSDDSNIISLTTVPSERHKRSAELPLNDNSFTSSAHHSAGHSFDYLPSIRQGHSSSTHRPTSYSHEHGNSIFSGNAVYLPPPNSHLSHSGPSPSLPAPNMVSNPSYSWNAGDMNPHNFNAPLSTAVLPQLFSTGLVDDGGHPSHARTHPHPDQYSHSSSRRFPPQYFDYSSYPQLGSAYDIPQSVQQSHQQSAQNPHLFMQPPYNPYNNSPYNNNR